MTAKRIAIITGAGRGIGRAIALSLAGHGFRVALAARTVAQLEKVAGEIEAAGGEALAVAMDVTSDQSVFDGMKAVAGKWGAPDILINNAGIARSAPLVKTDLELWNDTLAVNLTGTYLCTRAAIPGMIEKGWGRVVNIASTAGKVGGGYISAYSASKHGVIGFTRSVALELAGKGVTVNAVCPGYVNTDLTEQSIRNIVDKTGKSEDEARKILEAKSPQNRLMEPEEVAALVLYLCSEEAQGINGQAINLDGGQTTA